jgi:hypothetical protein
MPIRMAALNLSATGATKSRKAIPKDVRAEYKRLYGVSHEAILVVSAGTSKAQAKALHGGWLAEVETRRYGPSLVVTLASCVSGPA